MVVISITAIDDRKSLNTDFDHSYASEALFQRLAKKSPTRSNIFLFWVSFGIDFIISFACFASLSAVSIDNEFIASIVELSTFFKM